MPTTISLTKRETAESIQPVAEAIASARYMTNAEGNKTDIILPLPIWEKLLVWLEEQDDRALVREMLPRLKMGQEKAGALSWDQVSAQWDE
ncbi:MAG: hypothetical protein NT075_06325 [Chloroflexi bacterium]|nr:hypothetical protein [Chloroflexota bacterium]